MLKAESAMISKGSDIETVCTDSGDINIDSQSSDDRSGPQFPFESLTLPASLLPLKKSNDNTELQPQTVAQDPPSDNQNTGSSHQGFTDHIIHPEKTHSSSEEHILQPYNHYDSAMGNILDTQDLSQDIQEAEPWLFEDQVAQLTHSPSLQQDHNPLSNSDSHSNLIATNRLCTSVLCDFRPFSIDGVVSQVYENQNEDRQEEHLDSEKIITEREGEDHEDKEEDLETKDDGKETFSSLFKKKRRPMKYLMTMLVLILALISGLIFSSFPLFTCLHKNGACFPQLTVQLTDKSPVAKTALVTVKEALKVLTYLAIDFGDSTSELDMINNRLDSYYQDKVIDTFSVNTLYQLSFLGYCRVSSKNKKNFCMSSYGLDLLSVFVRDAGVQLGELTRTNTGIMGDSFALAYELAISAFNQFTNKENHSVEYIDYAVLLQKFSKGLGFLTLARFVIGCILLAFATLLLILKYKFFLRGLSIGKNYFMRKCLLISMISLSFLNLVTGFLICSLTFEYILRLSEVGQNVGIANVNRASGFTFIWIAFIFEIFACCFIVYLANGFRKRLF